jgi:hypothetical protein
MAPNLQKLADAEKVILILIKIRTSARIDTLQLRITAEKENAMKTRVFEKLAIVMMTVLLSLTGGVVFAADHAPLTPELAAKKENHRRQKEQQVSHEKRKAAADNLKAERMRVYQAKQAAKPSKPGKHDN